MATITDRLKKVTNKLFTTPIIYQQKGEQLGRFGNSEKDITSTDYNLLGFVVWENKGESSKSDIQVIGKADLAEGYVLFHWEDVKNVGLIDSDDILVMNGNKDFIVIKNQRLELLSATVVGPDWVTTNTVLIKCYFRKEV